MALLSDYLRAAAERRFEWGTHDCGTFVWGWVEAATGVDALAPLRGRYTTARGCLCVMRRLGHANLLSAAEAGATAAGLAPLCGDPVPGDIGVVDSITSGPVLALRCASGWAVPAVRGVRIAPLPLIKGWGVEWHRC